MVQGLLNILSPRTKFRKCGLSLGTNLMTAGRSHRAGTGIQSPWLFRVLTQRIVKEELLLRHIIMIHVWACSFICMSCTGSSCLHVWEWRRWHWTYGGTPSTNNAALIAVKQNLQHVRTSLTKNRLAFIIDIERRSCRRWAAVLPEALLCTGAAQTPTPAPGDLWPQERPVCKSRCATGTKILHAAPWLGQARFVYAPLPIVCFNSISYSANYQTCSSTSEC